MIHKSNLKFIFDPEVRRPCRRDGDHPRLRWDDLVRIFCWKLWILYHGRDWFDIVCQRRFERCEHDFVLFICNL